jgi:hypothetical protein
MRSRRNLVIGAGLLLGAVVVALAAPAQRSDPTPTRETSSHAVVAAAGTVQATRAAFAPSPRAFSGAFLAYIVAGVSLALALTARTHPSLSARALIVRAGLGRRGRAPPFVRS